MLGVMLQRPSCSFELANDRDERIVAWWRAVRDHPDDFARLVEFTPHSRAEYERALRRLDHPSLLERAVAVHIVLEQSVVAGMASRAWRVCRLASGWNYPSRPTGFTRERIARLHRRIRGVTLEARDAVEVLEDFAGRTDAVIYLDPPYRSGSSSEPYAHSDFDAGQLSHLLARAGARCAVSGYGTEWDHLGWRRHEYATFCPMQVAGGDRSRTEVLWTNYAPEQQQQLWD